MVFGKSAQIKSKTAAKAKSKAAKLQATKRVDYHEFIPYFIHFNPHTLMTKDGELVQVIKIACNARGETNENIDGIHNTIRDIIRDVISGTELHDKVAFWLHTIRRRRPMKFSAKFDDNFAGYINNGWEKQTHYDHQYYNEIYITFMHDGQIAPMFDKNNFKSVVFPISNRKYRNKYLDALQITMDKLADSLLEKLNVECQAKRLSMVERPLPATGKAPRQNIFYSELMEFFGNVFNLREEQFPVQDLSISSALQTAMLEFGFNAMEAKSKKTGESRFAALLTLKQFRDIPIATVDRVMQAPIEMVISQHLVFVAQTKVLKHYVEQKELFELSGDKESLEDFGINRMLSRNTNKVTDYCEQQVSVMVIVDDFAKLDNDVSTFQKVFMDLGLVTVREDMRMEETFWAQFPGNFEFIRRRNTISIHNIAGFCRLNRFGYGKPSENHWGECVSLIPTTVGSPYYFNFHNGDNGHTMIFDFNQFVDRTGKILQHFLLSQTQKFPAKIALFDFEQSAHLFIRKLGGKYYTMNQIAKVNRDAAEDKTPKIALNPFSLEDSNYNKSFLAAWCGLLLSPNEPISDGTKAILREAVEQLFTLPQHERNLPQMVELLGKSVPDLATQLQSWIGKGEYAGLFDFSEETLDSTMPLLGFNLTHAVIKPAFLMPLFSYLLHRTINALDGTTPTIIVINEAFSLLDNHFFAPRLESMLEMLKQRNVMVMLTTSTPKNAPNHSIFNTIMENCATHIYIPEEIDIEYDKFGIGLNTHDALAMLFMHRQKGEFLLKQNGESIGLKVLLQDAEDSVAIMTNDLKGLGAAHGRFSNIPSDY